MNVASLPSGRDYFTLRGNLDNCRLRFERERRGRVVFLGGSITEMPGWRDHVGEILRERFPHTAFELVNAGISSTGSVPGAFRLAEHAFGGGPVDLLFVDAAVNDHTNQPAQPRPWLRGMEGILRRARCLNPRIDIVMLHCAEPDKSADYRSGRVPDVIAVHEQAAAHYGVSSVDFAREVTERVDAGQFSWERDFVSLHPSPFGHRLYASTLGRLLAQAWRKPLLRGAEAVAHAAPARPLDAFSYGAGVLAPLGSAQPGAGWRIDPDWAPASPGEETRPRFVRVPMLVAEQAGAELTLDFSGTAAGVWVVAGPDTGILESQVDDGPVREQDLFTLWSVGLHIPWVYVLADELAPGPHRLRLRTSARRNPRSKGNACRIWSFVINAGGAT